jgi:hypothetical protein
MFIIDHFQVKSGSGDEMMLDEEAASCTSTGNPTQQSNE